MSDDVSPVNIQMLLATAPTGAQDSHSAHVREIGEWARKVEELQAELAQARLALASAESQAISFLAEKERNQEIIDRLHRKMDRWRQSDIALEEREACAKLVEAICGKQPTCVCGLAVAIRARGAP